jgi:hypothetical protein
MSKIIRKYHNPLEQEIGLGYRTKYVHEIRCMQFVMTVSQQKQQRNRIVSTLKIVSSESNPFNSDAHHQEGAKNMNLIAEGKDYK